MHHRLFRKGRAEGTSHRRGEKSSRRERERGQTETRYCAASGRHVCSILVDCRSLTPLCALGDAHVTQYTHLIRLAAVCPGWTEKNNWNIASHRRIERAKEIEREGNTCSITFLGKISWRIWRLVGKNISSIIQCWYIFTICNAGSAAFPQNRFEIVSFEIFCGRAPQEIFAPTPIATLTTAMILDPLGLFRRGDRVKFR